MRTGHIDTPSTGYDLLIVGSGASGLVCALAAKLRGLSPLVIEKASVYGGTTAVSGGVMWIPNSPAAKSKGIRDSPGRVRTYLRGHVGNASSDAKVDAFIEAGPKMLDELARQGFLKVELFATFPDYHAESEGGLEGGRSVEPTIFAGASLGDELTHLRSASALAPGGIVGTMNELHTLAKVRSQPSALRKVWRVAPRTVWNKVARRRYLANGLSLVAQLRHGLMSAGIPLWLNTELVRLVTENGRVVSAQVRRDGQEITVAATAGVVLAAGGFERNEAMRAEYPLPVHTTAYTSGADTNTGDSVSLAIEAGAAAEQMDKAWWAPTFMPPGEPPRICIFERGKPGYVIVDSDGQRFLDEAQPYGPFVKTVLAAQSQGRKTVPAFMIFDDRYRSRYPFYRWLPGHTPQKYLDNGFVARADALSELADKLGIDASGLTTTIARFNAMAATGVDEDFRRGESAFDRYAGDSTVKPNPCLAPVSEAPFYGVLLYPGDLGTCGGLSINEHAQVLDTRGDPIPGLYAVGNTAGSPLGGFYPGAGGTIGPGMTFGYIAADHAAKAAREPVRTHVPGT